MSLLDVVLVWQPSKSAPTFPAEKDQPKSFRCASKKKENSLH